ncbi:hypothetical protein OE88DRAFT_333833 [Heliocybe sulcata]|uniref:Uncharacterized protein n=1 Tax=Heliocybe sulcata TaxID=5364 RepID=A0A5C3N180_9AGAM|nr:hypothetical protein OE88DRAFT_333833 [Heliocybe sulcata]
MRSALFTSSLATSGRDRRILNLLPSTRPGYLHATQPLIWGTAVWLQLLRSDRTEIHSLAAIWQMDTETRLHIRFPRFVRRCSWFRANRRLSHYLLSDCRSRYVIGPAFKPRWRPHSCWSTILGCARAAFRLRSLHVNEHATGSRIVPAASHSYRVVLVGGPRYLDDLQQPLLCLATVLVHEVPAVHQ